jgi:DNA-binding transcriptional regulator PaaX
MIKKRMINEKNFINKYPVSLNDAIFFPLIYKTFINLKDQPLPDTNLNHILKFSNFTGFSKGAVRTALTRLKKKGSIISYKENGKIFYKMSEIRAKASNYYMDNNKKKEFTIVIYSFKRENKIERYQIRKILKKFGFKMLTQNVYINLKIKKDEFISRIKNAGLENNLYIYDTLETLEPFVAKNILNAWDIDNNLKELNAFYIDFKDFISFNDNDAEKIFNHLGYAGAVVFSYFQRNEIPVPDAFLPENYPLKIINSDLINANMKYINITKNYYLKLV